MEHQTKRCSSCKETKPVTEFYRRNSKRGDGFQSNCKRCNTKQKSEWIQGNRDKVKWNSLWNRHRLRKEDIEYLLEKQEHKCGICLCIIDTDTLNVDHDHECCPEGKSCIKCRRGLLCMSCNHRVGWYEAMHKPEVEQYMIEYLNRGPLE